MTWDFQFFYLVTEFRLMLGMLMGLIVVGSILESEQGTLGTLVYRRDSGCSMRTLFYELKIRKCAHTYCRAERKKEEGSEEETQRARGKASRAERREAREATARRGQ